MDGFLKQGDHLFRKLGNYVSESDSSQGIVRELYTKKYCQRHLFIVKFVVGVTRVFNICSDVICGALQCVIIMLPLSWFIVSMHDHIWSYLLA